MSQYFDPAVSDSEIGRRFPGTMRSVGRFDASRTRASLVRQGFRDENVKRYVYRPFDLRWIYWESDSGLLDRSRADYVGQVFAGNCWIEARKHQPHDVFDRGYYVAAVADNFGNGLSSFFPLFLKPQSSTLFSLVERLEPRPNIAPFAAACMQELETTPNDLFFHTLAILNAPFYRQAFASALRQDWPRIPLPLDGDVLKRSAAIGRRVAALLNPDTQVEGVSTGRLLPELRLLGGVMRQGGGPLDPASGDLAMSAGWGHRGVAGATMPGQGRVIERDFADEERVLLSETQIALLGQTTYDVYLNDIALWRNVPANVWSYSAAGYQVLKKWLSYREQVVLERPISVDEARTFTSIVRRVAAIRLLEPQLDANFAACAAANSVLET